ncbi:YgjP-like metallopeptidase domain-containing protein [Gallaecimonas sp. GXIMD4217]|uniref:YgjP-like metallopeptidase domain-containing protein n=1 Tax=Gallaecimonas sp. GXIMD4217 TaxID=3131927 RepID=UPI00311AD6D9
MQQLKYLAGYPAQLQQQARQLIDSGKLGPYLERKYPRTNTLTSDKALFEEVQRLRSRFLRNAAPISKACYDSKIQVIKHALGQHHYVQRVQGSRLKTKNEIRVASIFKEAPADFLTMILVHELAHVREKEHNKAFYQLCCHMEPGYHQLELDMRLWLTHRELG